jgi:hypothetical protein
MTNEALIYLVAASCGVLILTAYVAWILIPAWTAYERLWQRLVAAVLSVYVLVAFIGIGVLAGGTVVWYWDRISV